MGFNSGFKALKFYVNKCVYYRGQEVFLNTVDGTDGLSRNVGEKLPLLVS